MRLLVSLLSHVTRTISKRVVTRAVALLAGSNRVLYSTYLAEPSSILVKS